MSEDGAKGLPPIAPSIPSLPTPPEPGRPFLQRQESDNLKGWETVKVGSAARWHTPAAAAAAAAAADTAASETEQDKAAADGGGSDGGSNGGGGGSDMHPSASNTSLASQRSTESEGVMAVSRAANKKAFTSEYSVRTPVVASGIGGRKAHRSRSLNFGDASDPVSAASWRALGGIGAALGESGRQDLAHFAMRRDGKLLLAMVGLPARGKSYIAKGIQRHLDWLGIKTQIFNAGNYRRQVAGPNAPASLFDPDNPDGKRMRQRCAEMALEDAFRALEEEDVCVAIFDATNTTKARRAWVVEEVRRRQPPAPEAEAAAAAAGSGGSGDGAGLARSVSANDAAAAAAAAASYSHASGGMDAVPDRVQRAPTQRCAEMGVVRLVFLESYCDRDDMIWENVKEAKMHSPDYAGWKEDDAMADFFARINNYKKVYEMVEEAEGVSFLRLENTGEKLITFRARGYAIGRITQLLSNTQLALRPIILTRPGESLSTSQARLGMDTGLTPQGDLYAQRLCETVHEVARRQKSRPVIWASDMTSAHQTVQPLVDLGYDVVHLPALNDLNAGAMSGLTYDQFAEKYPEEYEARVQQKLTYRFPKGESYNDVFTRVEPIILELIGESSPVVVVSHTPVLRIIYGYLHGTAPEECPLVDVPLHACIILRPCGYGYEEKRAFPLG